MPSSICGQKTHGNVATLCCLDQGPPEFLAAIADKGAESIEKRLLGKAHQAPALQEAQHAGTQVLDRERLGEIVKGVGTQTVQGAIHRRVRCHDDDAGIGLVLLNPFQHLDRLDARQNIVQNDELIIMLLQLLFDKFRVKHHVDEEVEQLQRRSNHSADVAFVVDNQHANGVGAARLDLVSLKRERVLGGFPFRSTFVNGWLRSFHYVFL